MSGADGRGETSPSSIRETLLNRWWRNPNGKPPSSPTESHNAYLSAGPTSHDSHGPVRRVRSPHRRKRYWPPGPIVEDVAEALAKEHAASGNQSDSAYESGEETPVRGSIDQQPIILGAEEPVRADSTDGSSVDSDDSLGEQYVKRPDALAFNTEERKNANPSRNEPRSTYDPESKGLGKDLKRESRGKIDRSKHGESNRSRSRPNIPRLHTDLDEPSTSFGQRAASPYSFTSASKKHLKEKLNTPLVEQLLSPESYFTPKLPSNASKRSGSYTFSKDALRELQNDAARGKVRDRDDARGRSARHLSVNADTRESRSVEPTHARRFERRRSSSADPLAQPMASASIRREEPPARRETEPPKRHRERRGPGKIELPEPTPPVAPRIDFSSEDSEHEHHRRRTRKPRSPLVTPDGQRVSRQEDGYFNIPKPSHRRHESGSYHRADSKRLEELRSAELPARQPSSPRATSRPSTPELPSAKGLVTPGLGSSTFPWTDSVPSSAALSSKPGSRPGSSAGSTPPSPASPLHSTSTPVPIDSQPSRAGTESAHRGRRSMPVSVEDSSFPEPSVTPRPGPHQTARSSTAPHIQSAPSSAPAPNFLQVRPRLDVTSPGHTRRSHSYARDQDGHPASPHASPRSSPRSSRESSPTSLAREKLKVAPLPTCPRSQHTRGYSDWSSLVNFPDFNICPSCLNGSIGSTPHRAYFVPSSPKAASAETRCDFSLPWIRVAWVLTLKQRKKTLELVYATARIAATFRPCPRATGADRQWYTVVHPDTGYLVGNFNVCPCCKESLEVLLPPLRGMFVPTAPRTSGPGRPCDLRFDSKRFLGFVDELEATAKRATRSSGSGIPDMRNFAKFAHERASLRECPGADLVAGRGWHVIPALPDFTVCEECFHDIVWPVIESGESYEVADRFGRRQQYVAPAPGEQGVVCRLASTKVRETWRVAVDRGDLEVLRRGLREELRAGR